jgi:hypothetical protein
MANIISVKRTPSKATPGDVIFNNVEKEFYIAVADGTLLPVAGMLTPNPRGVVGPQGEPGARGETGAQGPAGINGRNGADSTVPGPTGPRGERGAAGRDGDRGKPGVDGKDSTIAGPVGPQGPAGPRGEKGEPGDVVFPTALQVANALVELRQRYARIQAALLLEMANSKSIKSASTRLHLQNTLNRIKREAGI